VTLGSHQPVSGAPKCFKHGKSTFLVFFSLSSDGVRPTISKHAVLKVGGGKMKTGRKHNSEHSHAIWYAQGPVPPQPQPSIPPAKAWLPKMRSIQFPRQNSGAWFTPGPPFTHTDKQKHKPVSDYSWLKKTVILLYYQRYKHDENMKNWLQELGQRCLLFLPFLPSSSLYGTE